MAATLSVSKDYLKIKYSENQDEKVKPLDMLFKINREVKTVEVCKGDFARPGCRYKKYITSYYNNEGFMGSEIGTDQTLFDEGKPHALSDFLG